MELEKEAEVLSPEEQAFFESAGEQEITAEPQTEAGATATEPSDEEKAAAEQRERDEKGRFVPHQALHAEREERKKAQAEAAELREKWARLEERFNAFSQAKQPEQQEEAPPDPNVDVFAALKWTQEKLLAAEKAQQEAKTQQEAEIRAKEQDQAVWSHWENDARQYAQTNPDFQNAAKWLAETRDKQLQAVSVVDPRFSDVRMRNWQIEQELKQIVLGSAQRGMSAAEAVYQLAQSYGYAPSQQQQADPNKDVLEKLDKLEQAQQAGRTVGQSPGKGGGDEITAETLLAMPESEFNAWMSVPANAKRFQAMMGG